MGKEYEASKRKWGRSDGLNAKVSYQNGNLLDKPKGKTAQNIANHHGVGYGTVIRNEEFAAAVDKIGAVSPVAKSKKLAGEASITKTAVRELGKADATEVAKVAKAIEGGTY